jgi:hypothetical protein
MIGETGKPWGILVSIGDIGSLSLSNDRVTCHLLRHEFTHSTIF